MSGRGDLILSTIFDASAEVSQHRQYKSDDEFLLARKKLSGLNSQCRIVEPKLYDLNYVFS